MAVITSPTDASGQINLTGTSRDDIIHAHDYADIRQTHVYAGNGNDVINMYFGEGDRYRATWNSQHEEYLGHHVRGGSGDDVFNFASLFSVTGTVVGRVEDFDASRDVIEIEETAITPSELAQGYGQTSGYNWKIVEWNGDYNDPKSSPQQWLLINTNGGWVFYSLEGARVDVTGDGAANNGNQEGHFITTAPPDFASMTSVGYVDPVNAVPEKDNGSEYLPSNGGLLVNDVDGDGSDVEEVIQGNSGNDVIAAGLNDDNVKAGGGNDRIWGGSGNDTLNGNNGNDTLRGGAGDDKITGGKGNDCLYGENGSDVLNGWGGDDRQYGGNGNDRLFGQQGNDTLDGGSLNDELYGSRGYDVLLGRNGNDLLNGGQGSDTVTGGSGSDTFEFKSSDLMDWDSLSGSWANKNDQLDLITDFTIGSDKIAFAGFSSVNSMSDLKAWKSTIDGNVHFTVQVRETNERILVEVGDSINWSQFFDSENFMFT
ncbi:calcium-binding protein [Pseudophaeobacter sp.]|uniref:calcium-binding protein n=1 Tax=Pseudophaeobacter sp. TaxID=1971739 RepID=UPI00329A63DC